MSDTHELLFLRGYKDAIMHFNMLDRNLAYCLQWASIHAGREAGLLTVLAYPFDKKLKKIVALITMSGRTSEYSEFLVRAEQCRTQRNKLVHGHWEFAADQAKPIRFHVPAPFEEQGSLTQDEFSALVAPFIATSSLFIKLQKKHPVSRDPPAEPGPAARRDGPAAFCN